jgi:DnaK suppressor protein
MADEADPSPPAPDLEQVRSALLEKRASIEERLAVMKKPPERGSTIGFGKRIGDGTSEAVSRISEVALADDLEITASGVDRALEKIEEGTYGICDGCGEPIAAGRLKVSPASSLCIGCAQRQV